jgi:dihydroorotate dehydrogenase (fumarate)
VKLPASLNSPGHFAATLARNRASGFVLFNRLPEPDPLRLMLVYRRALSEPDEIRLPLLWTALLSGRIDVSLAASGGVASVNDAVKYLLAGADVVMAASALLRHVA